MPPSVVQKLNRIVSSPKAESDVHEEALFDCCWCGNQDDIAIAASAEDTPLPSTEVLVETFWRILDAPKQPNDPLHFAVESLIPLQQITKWALKSEFVQDDEMKIFLTDVEKIRGIGIILLFLANNIGDGTAVMCSVRAIQALLVDLKRDGAGSGKGATRQSNERSRLVRAFLKENGMETLIRAFNLHALTPFDSRGEELFSQMELRSKTVDILMVALPHSAADSAANVLRFLCSVTPQMVGLLNERDKTANKQLLQKTILSIAKAIQAGGIKRKLTMADAVDVVNVTVHVMKACPKDDEVTADVRVLWSWASSF